MPFYLSSLRTTCVFALLCLLAACKKNDHWPPKPDACGCDAKNFIAITGNDHVLYSNRGYRFDKTYKADGSIDKFYMDVWGPASPFEYIAYFKTAGNWAYLIDSVGQDTILRVELNSRKQPVRSFLKDPLGFVGPWQYYTYNSKGQLIKAAKGDVYGAYSVKYDPYGNVLAYIWDMDTSYSITFTYDYNTPIKAGSYFVDDADIATREVMILQLLGLLPGSPHHKMLTVKGLSYYPAFDRSFVNQQINEEGYVTYYETTLWASGNDLLRCTTNWHCNGKQSPQKY